MVSLEFEGICKKCPHAELELTLDITYKDGDEERTWDVECKHYEACLYMREKTLRERKICDALGV